MKRFISLIFFATLAFGGELADLSNECKKGNDEICKRLSVALKNLELACDEGGEKNAMSCAGLGYFYEFDKVFTKSVRYYEKACELGADKACVYLGLLYQNGQGAAQDHKKANELFARACGKGVAQGARAWGIATARGLASIRTVKRRTSCLPKPANWARKRRATILA